MAGAQYSTFSSLTLSVYAPTAPKKPVALASISTPSPLKLRKRKNYLRHKLLETLSKPYSTPVNPQPPPPKPVIPIQLDEFETPSDQTAGEHFPIAAGEDGGAELQVSEASVDAGVSNGSVKSLSSGSVLKFVLYVVGIFVFQTVCAVWVLASVDFDRKGGSLGGEDESEASQLGANVTKKMRPLLNGSKKLLFGKFGSGQDDVVHLDDSEVEGKIVEIRAMAREARKREGKEEKANGSVLSLDDAGDGEDADGVVSRARSGIEKEVDARLGRVQKRLNSIRDKSITSLTSYLSKSAKVEGEGNEVSSDVKEVNGKLMFKKTFKFRNPPVEPRNKPKGFHPLKDHNSSKKKNKKSRNLGPIMKSGCNGYDGLDILDREKQPNLVGGDLQGSVSMPLDKKVGGKPLNKESKAMKSDEKNLDEEKGRSKMGEQMGFLKSVLKTGVIQETSHGKSSIEAVKTRNSSVLETHNSQSVVKETQENTTGTHGHAAMSKNGSFRSDGVRSEPSLKNLGKISDRADFWWSNLRYVFAIFMQRGPTGEGSGGLFTLKVASSTLNQSDSSYSVAFEDRGDATNFCCILEAFFEDLGDFSADIVPLSIKELLEAVDSQTMKVLVVKKGQIQLYVGQPLADVEIAFLSLIDND